MTPMRMVLSITCAALMAVAAHAQPQNFDLGPLKATVTPPAGWKVMEGAPPTFFDEAKKGSVSFVGSPMPMPEATFAVMKNAALEAAKAQVKAGTMVKAEDKSISGVPGILTVESAKDPTIRRMQWQGWGKGGYFTVMMASTPENFDGYLSTFEAVLGSVKLAGK